MSHFNIDPAFARDYFKSTFDLMEKMEHDARLHDAYFNGLFPSVEEANQDLEVWSFIKGIHRKYADVSFIRPKKMPDVGTIGHADEPCLNELTRLMRGYYTHNDVPKWIPPVNLPMTELSIVSARPTTSTAIRPEVIEVYKSRRQDGTGMHVGLESAKPYLIKRYLDVMDITTESERGLMK